MVDKGQAQVVKFLGWGKSPTFHQREVNTMDAGSSSGTSGSTGHIRSIDHLHAMVCRRI